MELQEKLLEAYEKDTICKWLSEQVNNAEPVKLLLELREKRKTEISDEIINEAN